MVAHRERVRRVRPEGKAQLWRVSGGQQCLSKFAHAWVPGISCLIPSPEPDLGARNRYFCQSQELEWVRPVIVFHAAIAVKPKASKMYYT